MPDYGAIIRRSIEVVKKNKWLWVFGALVGGSFFSGFNYINNLPGSGQKNTPFQENLPEKATQILGEATSVISAWLSSISPFTLVLLGLGLAALIIMGIAVGFIVSTWAKGALIAGSQNALEDKKVNLTDTSAVGLAKIKKLISFSLIIFGIYIIFFAVLPVAWLLVFLAIKNITILKILWVISGVIVGFLVFILTIVFTTMASIYAERLIVLKNLSPWEATKKALSLSKKSFMATAVMGIVNTASSAAFGCLSTLLVILVLGIPTVVLLYPSFTYKQFPSPVTIMFLILFLILFIIAQMLIRAVVVVFVYTNWNQMFEAALQKESLKETSLK